MGCGGCGKKLPRSPQAAPIAPVRAEQPKQAGPIPEEAVEQRAAENAILEQLAETLGMTVEEVKAKLAHKE